MVSSAACEWVWRRRTSRRPCCPPLSNPSTSSWTAWPDGSGRWYNRMAAQHLPLDLVRPNSGQKNWLKRMGDSHSQRQERHLRLCNGQATIKIPTRPGCLKPFLNARFRYVTRCAVTRAKLHTMVASNRRGRAYWSMVVWLFESHANAVGSRLYS